MSTPNHLAPERLLALRSETVHSKKRLFEQAAASISAEFDLDQESVYRSLLAREKLGSTAIGHGVAIPHSRMSGCTEPLGCLILLSEGVDLVRLTVLTWRLPSYFWYRRPLRRITLICWLV